MDVPSCFPIWDQLTGAQQDRIRGSLTSRSVQKGALIHSGSADCTGLLLVRSGQLRAYILSEAGREITLYRLFERDVCLLSASCLIRSLQFDAAIEAEKDSSLWILPAEVYQQLREESAPVSNYTSELMAARFSEVMWLMEQILWQRMDKRVAAFLLEEAAIEGTGRLSITHEAIANHLGTHREVVTRMLRYLQNEGMVRLSRGAVALIAPKELAHLRDT